MAEMTPMIAFILGFWYYFAGGGGCWSFNLGFVGLGKPIFGGWLVGVLMGDAAGGLAIGAALQGVFLVNISAGGSQAYDATFAGIVGTAVALQTPGAVADQLLIALAVSIPLGLVGNMRTILHMTINSFWTHLADKQAEKGSYIGIFLWQVIVPQIVYAATAITIVYVACTAGGDVLANIVKDMPQWLKDALGAISGVLPAVGICMALNLIFKKNTAPFFFLGWVATQYLGLSGIPLTVVGCIIAYVATFGVKPQLGGAE